MDLMCPKCAEMRLVDRVRTSDRDQCYCSVCSHSWPHPAQNLTMPTPLRKSYDEARAEPEPCRCGRLVTRPEACTAGPCPFDRRGRSVRT
jgi:hypothetical protein